MTKPGTDTETSESSAGTQNPKSPAEAQKTDTATQPDKSETRFDPVTAAWSDGINEGKRRVLRTLGVKDEEELAGKISAAGKTAEELAKLKTVVDKPEELPAVKSLQAELEKARKALSEKDGLLRNHMINQTLEGLAKEAIDPRVARVLFLEAHRVDLNDKGEVEVRNLDGMPIYGEKPGEVLGLQGAFEKWFAKQAGLRRAAQTGGSSSQGGMGSEGKILTETALLGMSVKDYAAKREEILAAVKAGQMVRKG